MGAAGVMTVWVAAPPSDHDTNRNLPAAFVWLGAPMVITQPCQEVIVRGGTTEVPFNVRFGPLGVAASVTLTFFGR